MKRRQFLAKTSLVVGGLALGVAPSVDNTRLTPRSLRVGQDARVYEDLVRIAAGFADQLDMVSPTSLMPPVFGLLEQEKVLLAERAAPRLLEVTIRTAIVAGWLSYNVNNRGDAEAFWTFAVDRARELHSDQLMAYALGVRSNVFSAVPKRSGSPLDAALSIGQLEQAISLAKKGAPPALRAWLYSRRGEEYAVAGDRRGAYADVDRAHKVLGRHHEATDDFPILRTWRDARLSRYQGSVAELLGDHREAIAILANTLEQLLPSYLPQRAMALSDLATAYARLPRPEVEHSAGLLGQSHQIATRGGLGEANRRVMEARRHLQPWADAPAVKQLDEQLRLVVP
jgi:tetratricopeptide (TPR) repeat protein